MFRPIALALALLIATPTLALDIDAFTRAINQQRAANGLGAIEYNARLSEAAQRHAQDMISNGFIGHSGSNGSSVGDRARSARYCWTWVSENIAWQIPGEANVVAQWMGSDGHRRNILNRRAEDFGIARLGNDYWVLVLARGRDC